MNILFVCTGNTCRSPMAQALLEHKNIPGIAVKSAGLYAASSPISNGAAQALNEIGIDYKDHVSKQLSGMDIDWADTVYCMSAAHLAALPDTGRAFLLGGGISDPFGGDIARYRACRDEISAAIDEISALRVTPAGYDELSLIEPLERECFSTPWSLDALRGSYNNSTVFFVCRRFDSVIGYCGLQTVLDEGYITNLAVRESCRRGGAGSALIKAVLDYAVKKRLSFVTLEVRRSNLAAQALYTKNGFIPAGERRGFYSDPAEDAILFTRRFNI